MTRNDSPLLDSLSNDKEPNPSGSPFEDQGVVLHYHRWYETPPGSHLVTLEKRVLQCLLSPWRGGTLLEVGCGTGYFTHWLTELGFDVVGLDRSPPMVQEARKRHPHLRLLIADGEALPFLPHSFDIVTFVTSLEFTKHPDRSLREASRVSRKGILLGVINRHSLYGIHRSVFRRPPYQMAHFFSIRELRRLLSSNLNRDFHITWATAVLSSRFGGAPSSLPTGGFLALRVVFREG